MSVRGVIGGRSQGVRGAFAGHSWAVGGALAEELRGVRTVFARRLQMLALVWRWRRVRAAFKGAFAEHSQSICEALARCPPFSRAFAGRSRNESGTLSARGLLAGACGVILERSPGYRRALAGPSLGIHGTLAGRSRKICGAFMQCSRGVRKCLCLCGVCDEFARRSRSARGALAEHLRGARTVLAVFAGARETFAERVRNFERSRIARGLVG